MKENIYDSPELGFHAPIEQQQQKKSKIITAYNRSLRLILRIKSTMYYFLC